jgi:hypothetical protein
MFYHFFKDSETTVYRTWSVEEITKANLTSTESSPFDTINKALFKKNPEAKPAPTIIE